MPTMVRLVAADRDPARSVADRLRDELAQQDITAVVHVGHGLALVSVGADLIVWVECDGDGWHYVWWHGETHRLTKRWVFKHGRMKASGGPRG